MDKTWGQGQLGAIMLLADQDNKKPRCAGNGVYSIKLVAGAGSNLYLLPEQVKMVAGTGSHHNLLFETAA